MLQVMTRHPASIAAATAPAAAAAAAATDQILRNGFAMVAVGFGFGDCSDVSCHCPPDGDHAFTYTIGLPAVGLPEFVITGLSPVHAMQLTAHVYQQFRNGSPLPINQRHWLGAAPFIVRPVSDQWLANDPTRMAAWFVHAGRSPRGEPLPQVAQIVWGDADGYFPDDPRCDRFVADDQHIIADDPFGFPRRATRDQRRQFRHAGVSGHRRSA